MTTAPGDRGQLISKELSGASPTCLHFWYHMYGDDGMGSLRVFVKRGNKRWEQWMKTGNRGDQWRFRKITVKKHKRDKPFRVRLFVRSLFVTLAKGGPSLLVPRCFARDHWEG